MNLKKQKTNKLFFGKYPYKISTRVLGGNLIRIRGIQGTKHLCTTVHATTLYHREIDKPKLLNYINILEKFLNQDLKVRAESNTVNLFTEDKNLYKTLQKELAEYIVFISEPRTNEELKLLQTNKKYIICDELPKGKFKFKVTLRLKIPANVRKNLAAWLLKYSDSSIDLTPSNLELLQSGRAWWKECPIYVADDKMLTLLTLASGGYLRKTEEFVLRSSINNTTKGELLC